MSSYNKYVFFNCYLWVIGKTSDTPYHNGTPGQYSKSTVSLSTIDGLRKAVNEDLISLKYKVYKNTSIYPVIKNGYKVLAVRKVTDYSGDYHFMKLDSTTTKTWSFKAGWGGCVLRAASGMKPNNTSWYNYTYDGSIWRHGGTIYQGTIYYIVYK